MRTNPNERPRSDRMKLVDRVTKLLALADSTTHTPEAESARNMAAELMAKHNIGLAETLRSDDCFDKVNVVQTVKTAQKFDTSLACSIARFNSVCMILDERGVKSVFKYVGTPQDIEATLYMLNIVKQQRVSAYASYSEAFIASYGKTRWTNDETDWRRWHNGFTIGVQNKLRGLTDMSNKKVQAWGLVPVDACKQALAWYNKNIEGTQNTAGKMKSGSRAGFDAGKNVSIHKGIDGNNGVKQLN
jgi:hypothetical protein